MIIIALGVVFVFCVAVFASDMASLVQRAQKILVLTGPSGCGKTATLQALARVRSCTLTGVLALLIVSVLLVCVCLSCTQDMDAQLVEWLNPVGARWVFFLFLYMFCVGFLAHVCFAQMPEGGFGLKQQSGPHESQMDAFASFLARSRQYPSLVFDDGSGNAAAVQVRVAAKSNGPHLSRH